MSNSRPTRIGIIYRHLFDEDGERLKIGGIETYIFHLLGVLRRAGYEPFVVQYGSHYWERELEGCKVIGVPPPRQTRRRRDLFDAALQFLDMQKDIILFAADHASVPNNFKRAISIQHGVSWDVVDVDDINKNKGKVRWLFANIARTIHQCRVSIRGALDFQNCSNRVCVDHNFLNWFKCSPLAWSTGRTWVIPNFTKVIDSNRGRDKSSPRIIFARRFTSYRGTRVAVEACKELLMRFPQLRVTFAGEGPDEIWMRSQFHGDNRIDFTRYEADKAQSFHQNYDIALIPSLGSEGTSLSVIEAMAAGCAVVASPAGGITNVIIDGYNGLLVAPSRPDIVEAISRLLVDDIHRTSLAENGRKTVMSAFSYDRWASQWLKVIAEVAAQGEQA